MFLLKAKSATVERYEHFKQAQTIVEKSLHIQLQQQFRLKFGCCNGFHDLFGGLMVFTDNSIHPSMGIRKLDGTYESPVPFEYNAYSIALINQSCVAVSHKQNAISIVNINTRKIIRTIKTKEMPSGVTTKDGEILYCAIAIGLRKLDFDTEEENTVYYDCSVSKHSKISALNGRICYSNFYKHNLTVLDSEYNVIFKYEDTNMLKGPLGIAIDQKGYVYATGYISENLVAVSPDGKKVDQLLSRDDGLNNPTLLHYDQYSRLIVTIDCWNRKVCKYWVQMK